MIHIGCHFPNTSPVVVDTFCLIRQCYNLLYYNMPQHINTLKILSAYHQQQHTYSKHEQPTSLPACLPACLLACLSACLHACLSQNDMPATVVGSKLHYISNWHVSDRSGDASLSIVRHAPKVAPPIIRLSLSKLY